MKLKDSVFHELLIANGYRSGGDLAKQFGVSRTAIWKVIEQLKEDGCKIEAASKRGYLLVSEPDLFSAGYLQFLTADCRIPWTVQYFHEVDSTNNYAKSLASQGAPEGSVVIADRQTAGKGRLGKQFHSPEGGLYMSLILRPSMSLDNMMAVTACTASAIHLALRDFDITTQIKWVNDLFLNGKKICGILTEGSFNAELLTMDYLVIGAGINLRPDPHLPEELKSVITDIGTETRQGIRRTTLAAAILRHLEQLLEELPQRTYLSVYTENSCTLGHHVRVRAARGECTALAVGFSDNAGLIVRHDDGSEEVIQTGTAQLLD
ncbi:MAG: biotin--[acetyl-CoA-carboxylase] ligase [Oscillospiraceae bacterium]|nr:biotin--[acetyl-CoA-carboxylase] ligase [Oscillospiraceae bacterium]